MSIERLVSDYISSVEHVLGEIKTVDKPLNMDFEGVKKSLSMLRPIWKTQSIIGRKCGLRLA